MAANYWESTQHRHWELGEAAEDYNNIEDPTLAEQYPLPDRRLVKLFIQKQITKLGQRLTSQIRQLGLATAQIYVARFYSKVDIRTTNPYLILTTALYLALKIEECPHHIRTVVTAAKELWPDVMQADVSKLGECEFWLISELSAQLIVHHPYRDLTKLRQEFSMTGEQFSLCWSVVNDHYLTALPLMHPPVIIAAAVASMVLTIGPSQTGLQARRAAASQAEQSSQGSERHASEQNQHLVRWLTESELNVEAVAECTQEFLSLYAALDRYSERTCREQVGRLAKYRS